MFRSYLREYRKQPIGIVDQIPWQSIIDVEQGILATTDDGLLCGFHVHPYDLGCLTMAEQGVIKLQINEAFKWLPAGWAVWQHERHVPYTEYPPAEWSDPVAELLDDEHRARMTAPGTLWTTETYMTLWNRAPSTAMNLIRQLFFTSPPPSVVDDDHTIQTFQSACRRIQDLLSLACRRIDRMDMAALLTYLHSLISIYQTPVSVPRAEIDIGAYLSDSDLTTGILPILGPVDPDTGAPTNGGVYLRCLTMSAELPDELSMGILRDLQQLDFSYDAHTRMMPQGLKVAEKTTTKTQINYLARRKSRRATIHEMLTKQDTKETNRHMGKQADDVDQVRDEALSHVHALGKLTKVWVVRHADLAEANRRIHAIQAVLHRHGCIPIDEDLNAVEACLSTLPGNIKHNVEQHQMTTLNFADLGPWHAPSRGVTWNAHLNGPPILQAKTYGCHPYGLSTHVGDQADAIGVGPKGSGKSTFLCWSRVQHLRYPGLQAHAFDHGKSARCLTLCLGGGYYDLGRGDAQMQVMSGIDRPAEYGRIYQWCKSRVEESGIAWHPDIGSYLDGGLLAMRDQPARPRRIEEYLNILTAHGNRFSALAGAQGNKRSEALALMAPVVRAAIRPFARGGVYGHLVDAANPTLSWRAINTFELEGLTNMPGVYPAIVEYLVPQLQDLLDGRVTIFDFDEAWNLFSNPSLLEFLRVSMPGWRRKNARGFFGVQSIAQLKGHALTPFLTDSCQVRLFFPNTKALDDDVLPHYMGMQLHREEVQANIALASPKGDVYAVRPESRCLIDVHLAPIALSICGANSEEDHHAMDDILEHHGSDDFAYHWLMHQGFPDAAKTVQRAVHRERLDEVIPLLSAVS